MPEGDDPTTTHAPKNSTCKPALEEPAVDGQVSPCHESVPLRNGGIHSTFIEIDLRVCTVERKLDDMQSNLQQIRSDITEMMVDI